MNVQYPAGVKPEWFDRNPSVKLFTYNAAGVGPHAATARITYTVPAARRAFTAFLTLFMQRATAAGTASDVIVYAYVYDNTNSAYVGYATFNSNTVGASDRVVLSVQAQLPASWTIYVKTSDASTGGTVNYNLGLEVVEFDA